MKETSIILLSIIVLVSSCKTTSNTTTYNVPKDTIALTGKSFHELGIANMTLQQIETYWGKGTYVTTFQMTEEECWDVNPDIDCNVLSDTSMTLEEYLWYLNEQMLRQVFFLNQNGHLTAIYGRETCISCIHMP